MIKLRKLVSLKIINYLLRSFFSIFFNKQYLSGYFYDKKCMGWYWAFRSLPGRLFGDNRNVPWPVHPNTIIGGAERIHFSSDDIHIFQVPGCYWQAHGGQIFVGKGCYIAPNVGIITTNHDISNLNRHVPGKDIVLSAKCWVGMNSVILPGVFLGENTVVAAGSVVTKSFPQGYCIVGGVPAKVIKVIEKHENHIDN